MIVKVLLLVIKNFVTVTESAITLSEYDMRVYKLIFLKSFLRNSLLFR